MQEWEYLIVLTENNSPRLVNERDLPNWTGGLTVIEYFNQLGKEGWELVCAYPDGSSVNPNGMIFKRPVASLRDRTVGL